MRGVTRRWTAIALACAAGCSGNSSSGGDAGSPHDFSALGALDFARRNARLISRIGGALLVTVGVLEVTGLWSAALVWLQTHWFSGYLPSM